MIVANDVTKAGAGFGTETNSVRIIPRGGEPVAFEGTKYETADAILDAVLSLKSAK